MKLKKQIQNLIDFQSPRIALKEIKTNDFSKNIHISQNFQLITLDGEPILELMLCKKCFQVRVRSRLTSTPIVRHLKQHEKVENSLNIDKKKNAKKKNNHASLYAASLNHAMKNYTPIPLVAQEYGTNLSRGQRLTIEKTVLSKGEPEAQITFSKNLKAILLKKINQANSQHTKDQLYQELTANERILCEKENAFREKTPIVENRLASQSFCFKPDAKQSQTLQFGDIAIPKPTGKNTSVPADLGNQALSDDVALERISIGHDAKEKPITIPILIVENEIKLEITKE